MPLLRGILSHVSVISMRLISKKLALNRNKWPDNLFWIVFIYLLWFFCCCWKRFQDETKWRRAKVTEDKQSPAMQPFWQVENQLPAFNFFPCCSSPAGAVGAAANLRGINLSNVCSWNEFNFLLFRQAARQTATSNKPQKPRRCLRLTTQGSGRGSDSGCSFHFNFCFAVFKRLFLLLFTSLLPCVLGK